MSLGDTLRELEASLLTSEVRKDRARVEHLLAEEFREFGSSGKVYTKADIVQFLQEEAATPLAMKEFACQPVSDGVALVTYRSERSGPDKTIEAMRSSLWVWRDQRWQMLFHQGTRLAARVSS